MLTWAFGLNAKARIEETFEAIRHISTSDKAQEANDALCHDKPFLGFRHECATSSCILATSVDQLPVRSRHQEILASHLNVESGVCKLPLE